MVWLILHPRIEHEIVRRTVATVWIPLSQMDEWDPNKEFAYFDASSRASRFGSSYILRSPSNEVPGQVGQQKELGPMLHWKRAVGCVCSLNLLATHRQRRSMARYATELATKLTPSDSNPVPSCFYHLQWSNANHSTAYTTAAGILTGVSSVSMLRLAHVAMFLNKDARHECYI